MKELTLSLDASTSATGWAVYDGPDLLDSGVVKPKGTFLERSLQMANKLKFKQSFTIDELNLKGIGWLLDSPLVHVEEVVE